MTTVKLLSPDQKIVRKRRQIVSELTTLVGAQNLISEPISLRPYETDALTAYRQLPLAVVLPTSTAMVVDTLKYCNENQIKVVPRGAGTSLCGGALPCQDGIVICISKMTRVLDIDYDNRAACVETGITNLAITEAVAANGFFYAPDPSSQLACTLAGNLAMNSGGAHCLKYGVTTNNILGMKVVLIDGEIVEIGGSHLDPGGYDFLALLTGSEGQLGIITEATVRILKAAEAARPMMLGFASSESAGACVAAIIGAGIIPVAIEFMDKPAIEVCEAFAKAGYPTDAEALLIVEAEGSEDEISAALERITEIARPFNPTTIKVSQDAVESARIWRGRKSAFGALGRISDFYCMDGTIPLGKLPDVLVEITNICNRHELKVANIFHAGDGNLHPLILFDANNADQADRAEQAGAEILALCVKVGGCLSGEHGVGIEKRELMRLQFSDNDLAIQMRIKTAFDPQWLLNPGKVFPIAADAKNTTAA